MTAQPAERVDDCEDDVCITCGDVALELAVVSVDGDTARCRDESGRFETVAIELVGPVGPGDRVLVHAGVALLHLQHGPHMTNRDEPEEP
ncbi:MAG: HypC/HybG/HupF family hydrogenase formation chaperone [Ilumatobacteraceae bacterium]